MRCRTLQLRGMKSLRKQGRDLPRYEEQAGSFPAPSRSAELAAGRDSFCSHPFHGNQHSFYFITLVLRQHLGGAIVEPLVVATTGRMSKRTELVQYKGSRRQVSVSTILTTSRREVQE